MVDIAGLLIIHNPFKKKTILGQLIIAFYRVACASDLKRNGPLVN